MGGQKPGKRFEAAFHRSIDQIPQSMSIRLLDGGKTGRNSVIGDFMMFSADGHVDLFECKATSHASLPLLNFADHQLEDLAEFASVCTTFRSWVAVNFYDRENVRRRNELVLVPAPMVHRLSVEAANGGRKSISRAFADEHGIWFQRAKGSMWDMSSFRESAGKGFR